MQKAIVSLAKSKVKTELGTILFFPGVVRLSERFKSDRQVGLWYVLT